MLAISEASLAVSFGPSYSTHSLQVAMTTICCSHTDHCAVDRVVRDSLWDEIHRRWLSNTFAMSAKDELTYQFTR